MPQALSLPESLVTTLRESEQGTFPPLSEEELGSLYALAYQLYKNGKYEDAKQFFHFLTIGNAFDRRFWMGLAACYQMLKEYVAAIECYSVAAIQDPEDPYTHWHAAECFLANGKTPEGLKALHSALTVAKKNPVHATLLAQLELVNSGWKNSINNKKEDR